ncbi:TIMELESS-interacting protein [Channa argus]|uniref:TIMELESS-interacting protein n=1 Tax=Channa argus TaxID=215402 RepID=UPI002944A3CC|nr:hypothetical protein Q8A73_002073 [Channa argus]
MPSKNGQREIPEYDSLEDEAFPPLPPPHSPGNGGQDEGDPFSNGVEEGEVSKLAEVPAAKRKGVKRPQPKLDAQRLISERGLPALRTLFDNVHFKGKGHEAENIRLLMQKMENWAHRLYPKLQFEDFIDRVEKLGNKKEVQTCLKRIRLDMPLTHEDYIVHDGEDEAVANMQVFEDPDPFNGASFANDLGPVHSTPAPAAPSLTEEQRRRIELNRQRALERRLACQRQQMSDSTNSLADVTKSADEPAAVSTTNLLNSSNNLDDMVGGSDEEPVDSSTQHPDINLLHKDSEPSAELTLDEEEKNRSPEH